MTNLEGSKILVFDTIIDHLQAFNISVSGLDK